MTATAPEARRGLRARRAALPPVLLVTLVLSGGPASAATAFKAVDHNWTVALNQATLHNVPNGGTFSYCASQDVSAITPSVAYTGAPVGEKYTERLIGPAAAGTLTIALTTNVDGDRTPLKFTKATGSWDNTYTPISFPVTFARQARTLPPGDFRFEVVLAGKVIAKTTVRLAARSSC